MCDVHSYCPHCATFVPTHLEVREETATPYGVTVSFSATVRVCDKCGETLFDRDLDDAIIRYAYELYKEKEK